MLKERVISAVIGIPLIIGVLYLGGIWWEIFFLFIGIIGLFEIYRMMKEKGLKPLWIPGYLLMLICFWQSKMDYGDMIFSLTLVLIITIILSVIAFPRIKFDDAALSFWGAIYIGILLGYALKIGHHFEHSFIIMLLTFVLTWCTDIGGYIFGKRWGKHKMTPVLSPKKTWEGAAGGVFLCVLAAWVFSKLTPYYSWHYGYVLVLGFLASIMAQLGDLFASSIKRYFGVKDAGHIIPGHGGVLDRFDSFMLVLPVVYYFFAFWVLQGK
ncbi:phosphatidate cytidylyltransferase [Thermosyntropha lipolytica DSM 11003]|uniref:Phosphatidate cytidylyltransferase n=1 Tax=Thermosyntropha lipolytica DSM 11003 TaxID=1123382 RepID=A0A1M5KXE7_9FIRM|nr:phosphatidate cytidylyltransferase [Thermosyntropha lipolytica]SHG57179.1 phosphatidate cytidylyltransferase [Thermosyntropha lipolytica DSM 11003]